MNCNFICKLHIRSDKQTAFPQTPLYWDEMGCGDGGRIPELGNKSHLSSLAFPSKYQLSAPNSQDALALPTLPLPLLEDITAKQGGETVVTVESLVGVSQKMASLKVDQKNKSFLSNLIAEEGNTRDIARFSSLGLPHSGSWLSVVPSPPLGLHLRPAEFIPILKYRLGIPVFSSAGPCTACGAEADCMGDHALGCPRTSDRIARHNMIRDVLYEAAASADLGPSRGGTPSPPRNCC